MASAAWAVLGSQALVFAVIVVALQAQMLEAAGSQVSMDAFDTLVQQLQNTSVSRIVLKADVRLRGPLPIVNRSLSIVGACSPLRACRIDGLGNYLLLQFRGLDKSSAINITLNTLTLANGLYNWTARSDDDPYLALQGGGAVRIYGAVSFLATKVTFQGNAAVDAPGAPQTWGGWERETFGGAVHYTAMGSNYPGYYIPRDDGQRISAEWEYGDFSAPFVSTPAPSGLITFKWCKFYNNSAQNGGGAIYFDGPTRLLTVIGSEFVMNRAASGGAIMSAAPLLVQGSLFHNNSARGSGGAIFVDGNKYEDWKEWEAPDCENSQDDTFCYSYSAILGVVNHVTAIIHSSSFRSNNANEGGAIAATQLKAFSLCSNTFAHNGLQSRDSSSKNVFLRNAPYTIQATFAPSIPRGTQFACQDFGGPCTVQAKVVPTNSCTTEFVPLSEENKLLFALMSTELNTTVVLKQDVLVTRSFPANQMTSAVPNRIVTVVGDCRTGAGVPRACVINVNGRTTLFEFGDSGFQDGGGWGSIDWDTSSLALTLSNLVIENAAATPVLVYNTALTLNNVTFNFNHYDNPIGWEIAEDICGGAVKIATQSEYEDDDPYYYYGKPFAFDNVVFKNNSAVNGGAVCVDHKNSSGSITNCWLEGNRSDGEGGAISTEGDLLIRNTTFKANSADMGGAIYAGEAAAVSVKLATFTANVAATAGGAIAKAMYDVYVYVGTPYWDTYVTVPPGILKVCTSTFQGNKVTNATNAYLAQVALLSISESDSYASIRDLREFVGGKRAYFCPKVPGGAGWFFTYGLVPPPSQLAKINAGVRKCKPRCM